MGAGASSSGRNRRGDRVLSGPDGGPSQDLMRRSEDVPERTSTASIQSADDGSETRPNPLATNDSTSDSSQSNDSIVTLSEGQQRNVRHCLNALESTLGISFKVDTILSNTCTVAYGPQEKILTQGAAGNGIFVVDEGVLEVFSPKGDTVLNRLLLGDFCGELSTLFAVPCSCSVHSEHRVTLLHLPTSLIRENMEGDLGREKLLQWCVKRSYVDTASVFGPGVLLHRVTSACLKASSIFTKWSDESIQLITKLTAPPILFTRGETVYSAGEESCNIFFVLRGAVECATNSQVISSKSIKCSGEGFSIGSKEFLSGARRSHKARALGPLLLVAVSNQVIVEALSRYPNEVVKLRDFIEKHGRRST